ncbi:hypothetical protein QE152_g27675 [Popillia japonica]|uniref:Ig-like domain-containing protein n=1 Tax=Popillia japonica TaxID=7064 RepID=A0AAW1JRA2_POPJA
MSIIFLYTFVLLFVTSNSQKYDDENILNDQPFYHPEITSTKPKIIRIGIQSNVTLTCSDDGSSYGGHSKWQFKPCSFDMKGTLCEQFYDNAYQLGSRDRWIKIHPRNSSLYRYSYDLDITNVSRTYSGLYRCIVNNRIQRVYEVIVSELINDKDKMSKIVINPKNITIPTNTELVIRCSVNNPSSIMWFKETDANGYDIMYDGHYYNSGVYVCVGVNEDSIKTEVNVVTVIGYNWEHHTSFSLFFLIPLAFALVPITVWLCYFRKKRKDYDRQRMKLMLNARTNPSSRV